MMFKIFIVLVLSVYLYAVDSQTQKNQFFNYDKNKSITVKKNNLPNATNNSNTKDWNLKDWENSFKKNGLSNSTPNNTQMLFHKIGQKAFTGDVNTLTNNRIKQDSNLKNIPSIKAWNSTLQSQTMSQSSSNRYVSVNNKSKNIKCYITRDIPFVWKCNKTGISYGGNINQSGKQAREECENNCYTQRACTNLNPNSTIANKSFPNLKCNFAEDNNCSKTFILDNSKILDKITFGIDNKTDNNTSNNNIFKITLSVLDNKNVSTDILKDSRSEFLDYNNSTVYVNKVAKSVKITVVPITPLKNSKNTKITVIDIKAHYRVDNKFICVYLQNIYGQTGDNYAYVCPSGRYKTFTVGNREYKICEDGKIQGDNPDGTFSSRESCEAICREASKCVPDQTTFNTNLLHTFREGCIRGQANCTDRECTDARMLGDTIINETIFDATYKKYTTIQNTIQNHAVNRPRVSLNSDLSFQKRNEEEWKDLSFKNMAKNGTYSEVLFPIGGDSEPSNAYQISMISGTAYGVTGTAVRSLFWLLKPKASDVYNNSNYYFYMLLSVRVGYSGFNLNGNKEIKNKEIWYIKTSKSDTFKPIKYGDDVGYSDLDNNATVYKSTGYSKLQDMTFIDNMWVSFSPTQIADYFTTFKFDDTNYYWRLPVINVMGNLIYKLPGLVRSKTYDSAGISATEHYDGKFDGTGDGILTYTVYVLYSKSILTYQEIYNKIVSGDILPIYKMGQENMFTRNITPDSIPQQKNIQIFQYGPANKTSVTTRIFPKKQDVGKKGFIFVFIQ